MRLILILLVSAFWILTACEDPNCENIHRSWSQFASQNRACSKDSDCTLLGQSDCVSLGVSNPAIAKSAVSKGQEYVREFGYCAILIKKNSGIGATDTTASEARCIEGICTPVYKSCGGSGGL
jgi:hypothetical protein